HHSILRSAMKYRYKYIFLAIVLLILPDLNIADAIAEDLHAKTTGQTVYVPAYSHIYHGNRAAELLLSVTLSIRNIDQDNPITISVVDYYETQGKLLKHFLNA